MTSLEGDEPSIGLRKSVPRKSGGVSPVRRYVRNHRAFISSLAFFVLMITAFATINPTIWTKPIVYSAVAINLPTLSIIAVALVFVVAAGEIDLSFGAAVTFTGLVFTYTALAGVNPAVAALCAVLAGIGIGLVNGVLVAYVGLSSLIATLGMSFFWAGLADILSNGSGMPLTVLRILVDDDPGRPDRQVPGPDVLGHRLRRSRRASLQSPKLGAYARYIGDNLAAAREMGVNIELTRLGVFGFVGLTAGVVGVMISLINVNFYPNAGNGLLLPVLAAVFVGGTPMLGGVGSIAGAFVGAMTISFISIGILTSGFSGFYTNFLYGIVIVLSAVVHTLSGIQANAGRKLWWTRRFRRDASH